MFRKRCTTPRGTLTKSPGPASTLVAKKDLEPAFEDVEGLLLARVDVRGRAAARRHERLHREVGAAGLLAGDQERVVVAGAPKAGPVAAGRCNSSPLETDWGETVT